MKANKKSLNNKSVKLSKTKEKDIRKGAALFVQNGKEAMKRLSKQ